MDTRAYYISEPDSALVRKVALRIKGSSRDDLEPSHLIFVLDTSDSMDYNDKLAACKRSIGFILDLMRDVDSITLITFDEDSSVLIKCVETKSENKVALHGIIDSIDTGGSTNMSAGLLETYNVIDTQTSARKQGIILLTDGHANLGVYNPDLLFGFIEKMISDLEGLTMYTIGYGYDHNVDLLSKIGEWSGGTYSVVNTPEDVATVFGSVLGSMVTTTAQNVKIILPANYKLLSQLHVEKLPDGRQLVRIGDIQSDVGTVVLMEVPNSITDPVTDPVTETIEVTGFNLLTHSIINTTLDIESHVHMSDEEKVNLDFAFLRLEIVALLSEVVTVRSTDSENFLSKLSSLEARLSISTNDTFSSIITIMKNDIKKMRDLISGRSVNMNIMAQHRSVYTINRGVTSGNDPENLTTPFLNRASSQYTATMRHLSSQ